MHPCQIHELSGGEASAKAPRPDRAAALAASRARLEASKERKRANARAKSQKRRWKESHELTHGTCDAPGALLLPPTVFSSTSNLSWSLLLMLEPPMPAAAPRCRLLI